MKKNYIIFTVFAVVALGVLIFSLYQTREAEKEAAVAPLGSPEGKIGEMPALQPLEPLKVQIPQPPAPGPEKRRELVPDNPADYGMVVIPEGNAPMSQLEWDRIISQKIEDSKSQVPDEDWRKAVDFIKEDASKTAEKIKLIDVKMQTYEEAIRANPNDEDIKGRLERLKMLKSISKKMREYQL